MKKRLDIFVVVLILFLAAATAYSNLYEQRSIDRSKIPEKVEENEDFQKWITNHKNKGIELEADNFRLKEENEVYNTQRMVVYSTDQDGVLESYQEIIEARRNLDDIVFSPSDRQFIDFRHDFRDGTFGDSFEPNDIHYYGLRDDKIIDSRILTCDEDANCYFDRAFFLSNDVFVISEFSRNIGRDEEYPACSLDEICTYTVKLHVIDLINNSNLVYESEPLELVLSEASQGF